jgi:uncharacterized repeat protein (TIGR03803 family)
VATLKTLLNFNGTNGSSPLGSLYIDAVGDLFGTTLVANAPDPQGTVFELKNTPTGYTAPPVTLAGFTGAGNPPGGDGPKAGLVADAAGDLFGTTSYGGAGGYGTVFEIAKSSSGYLPLATLATFAGGTAGSVPTSDLVIDSAGDLFGTTSGGGSGGYGTVFEIKRTSTGDSTVTLANFSSTNGASPMAGLFMDSAGNLFGTTEGGGSNNYGTVFEIAKSATSSSGYAALSTLVNFSYANGAGIYPYGSLIEDSAGDLFGTTEEGGVVNGVNDNSGTVFEIKKTATGGYQTTATTLVSFNGPDGTGPIGGLIADAAGDLFGTTSGGGSNYGTVFEIAKTATGYATTPTTVAQFTNTAGSSPGSKPDASLTVNAAGDLFSTTQFGGTSGDGTVFEITNSGYVTNAVAAGATLTVSTAVTVPTLLNNGTVNIVPRGDLDVSTAVALASTGVFDLSAQSELEIAACLGTGTKIQFLGGRAMLTLDNVAQFGAQAGSAPYAGPLIEGFVPADAIDLKGIASAGLEFSNSTQTGDFELTRGGAAVATLAFQNSSLGPGVFSLAADGSGGTIIAHG